MSDISDCIVKILADNGVSVEQKEIWTFAGKAENIIQLDFSEHDKRLIDEIMQLKQRIAELESEETVDLPCDPLECANYLINATYERETSSLERAFAKVPDKVNSDRYTIDELEQIAEHLLVYCKHNKESE